jgi:hypothetical protein
MSLYHLSTLTNSYAGVLLSIAMNSRFYWNRSKQLSNITQPPTGNTLKSQYYSESPTYLVTSTISHLIARPSTQVALNARARLIFCHGGLHPTPHPETMCHHSSQSSSVVEAIPVSTEIRDSRNVTIPHTKCCLG